MESSELEQSQAKVTHPMICHNLQGRLLACALIAFLAVPSFGETVARQWNEALLNAIRVDFPAPTVHARNLYHTSAAMYDAWATYDPIAKGHFVLDKHHAGDLGAARDEAISYAAYRVLSDRYQLSVLPEESQAIFDGLMNQLGYDPGVTTTVGNSPAAIGNRIANQILDGTLNDGSNEANGYVDNTGYVPTNIPMVVDYPGVVTPDAGPIADVNRWQPLFLDSAHDPEWHHGRFAPGIHWAALGFRNDFLRWGRTETTAGPTAGPAWIRDLHPCSVESAMPNTATTRTC